MTDHRVPRRSFLTTAAATITGAALGVSGAPALLGAAIPRRETLPEPPVHSGGSTIKLGVASYSLREIPLDKALEMIKALRTPYVNFKSVHVPYDKTPAELAEWRHKVEGEGIQIVGGGTITFDKDTDADVEKYFIYAKAAGMPTIVTMMGPTSVLPRIEKFAKQYDIKVAIHNHGP
ncbi:MAG: hypothetical protein ABI969_18395, partial [bacterium]